MSDWHGTTRSNYFKVKDLDSFKTMLSNFQVECITKENTDLVGFYSTTYNGGIPTCFPGNNLIEVSILDCIAPHLETNEVCVVQSVGAEKQRYLTGTAIAISHTGETVSISLSDIYKEAQEQFGGDASITEAIY